MAEREGGRPVVVRSAEARAFMEGDEACREYLRDARLWFGTSTLPPGASGTVDPGHASSVEIFYCFQGTVAIDDTSGTHHLGPGDAILIPEGVPHRIVNLGPDVAVLAWAGSPGE